MIVYKQPIKNYTKINNEFVQNREISAEARIVAVILMSYPNDWCVHTEHLSKVVGKSVRVIQKALKELVSIGKLKVVKYRDEQGKFTKGTDYEFVDEYESETIAELNDCEIEFLDSQQTESEKENEAQKVESDNNEKSAVLSASRFSTCRKMQATNNKYSTKEKI